MGGKQIPSCSNCRFFDKEVKEKPWFECWGSDGDHVCPDWKSKRGAKAGVGRKPGAGRHKFEDQGEKKQAMILSFKANDVTKAGGYKKVKTDLEKAFYDKIKGL